jgi:hypothetical protein
MERMPMNRHMTWGDRQAEAAREKQLAKLKKLAAMAPKPEEPAEETVTSSAKKAAPTKSAAKKPAAKPVPAAKKKATAPAKKSAKKR